MSYEMLRHRGYVQWPCRDDAPEGTQRLYVDHVFETATEDTEDYGHDLLTGAAVEADEHRALGAEGRAILKSAEWVPPPEAPDERFPLQLATGRNVYQFHTRTKTGRVPELDAAAPDVWVELHEDDARDLGIAEGDRCRNTSARGSMEATARLGGRRPGRVFVPFHYGYWDRSAGPPPAGPGRAANELTITAWDPVSRQPTLKQSSVRVERV
jgi:predicted molibdopterin-dependent oxidoreductase YjgC